MVGVLDHDEILHASIRYVPPANNRQLTLRPIRFKTKSANELEQPAIIG
jgi:hypothetical protein